MSYHYLSAFALPDLEVWFRVPRVRRGRVQVRVGEGYVWDASARWRRAFPVEVGAWLEVELDVGAREPVRGWRVVGRGRELEPQPEVAWLGEVAERMRAYFRRAGFVEVFPRTLIPWPAPDPHVEAFAVEGRFLHTSPEMEMKRLAVRGFRKMFFLGKVYRRGEEGPWHAEEFLMLEWYEPGAELAALRRRLEGLLRVLTGRRMRLKEYRWTELAARSLGIREEDLWSEAWYARLRDYGDSPWEALRAWMAVKVERKLGHEAPAWVVGYPAVYGTMAEGGRILQRGELFWRGIEVAHGYVELRDPEEHQRRLGSRFRDFIEEMEADLGPLVGCSVGVERLTALLRDLPGIRRLR